MDFCALDLYLREYCSGELIAQRFDTSLSSDTTSTTSGTYYYYDSKAADQSSNGSGSDGDVFEDEMLQFGKKNKHAKAQHNNRKYDIKYLRDKVQGLQAELKTLDTGPHAGEQRK
ncbi:hypothetical protein PC129_g14492 [Phytophthora cactorum]|uniref:Uncharacterized protein n=1 Tax=Phytophthora cactorum TaxID=29920 RepID=A0A329SN03_9STRA|nr:hypothetical protein Pcac1_g15046 [Phytophthora cactorum]KAG2810343.1 hypothetical protein PC112_g16096 [Phytophthora cactorum]KAG2811690.1 hypothetical protein PC111_g15130 [Phytophthora cactorum]KAG2851518.1 hypothetical protein PC113_g15842 [Phytophthora cactorum]KAG2899058.1 hypothetical protein PC114_g14033 [Phytophthora cactorum]